MLQNIKAKYVSKKKIFDAVHTKPGASTQELVALFRLLMREPPPGHNFKTCPICQEHGIKFL